MAALHHIWASIRSSLHPHMNLSLHVRLCDQFTPHVQEQSVKPTGVWPAVFTRLHKTQSKKYVLQHATCLDLPQRSYRQ